MDRITRAFLTVLFSRKTNGNPKEKPFAQGPTFSLLLGGEMKSHFSDLFASLGRLEDVRFQRPSGTARGQRATEPREGPVELGGPTFARFGLVLAAFRLFRVQRKGR